MKNLKKLAVVTVLVLSLLVGGVTTALAVDSDTGVSSEMTERKAALELEVPLEEYDLPVLVNTLTWEDGAAEQSAEHFGFSEVVNLVSDNFVGVEKEENGNSYFTVRYSATNTLHTYPYYQFNNQNTANNVVIEMDFAFFGNIHSGGIPFQHSSTDATDSGTRRYPGFFTINADGTISPQNGQKTSKSYVTPGEWVHLSMVYDRATCRMDLYVNYELVCDDINTMDPSAKDDHYVFTMVRFGPANAQSSEFSVDNFIAYEGSCIRTVDLFDNMAQYEKFNYCVQIMGRDESTVRNRKTAYDLAGELVGKYWDGTDYTVGNLSDEAAESVKASVDAYYAFNYDELYSGYIQDNLDRYAAMVAELEGMGRGLDLIAKRNEIVSKINAHLTAVGEDILKTEESNYDETTASYTELKQMLASEEYIVSFCNTVDKFYNALNFTTSTLQKHNAAAKAMLQELDTSLLGVKGFERFTESYERYLAETDMLTEKITGDNAQRIIDCVNFIKDYDTVEEWEANFDYIDRYATLIREAIRANDYDTEREGLAEAIEIFAAIDEYFYAKLQEKHIGVLNDKLDQCAAADGFVGKFVLCNYLDNYLAENDIDYTNEQISTLVYKLSIYKSELEQIKTDYIEILNQNTIIFKSTVEKMYTVTEYAQLAALYEEARLLYLAMNVGDESIKEHIAYYDIVNAKIAATEEASASFVMAAASLSAAVGEGDKDAIYAALVNCYAYSLGADISIEGVAEAMELYTAHRDSHDAHANACNEQVKESVHAVGSVRSNCGSADIVAIVVKKLED